MNTQLSFTNSIRILGLTFDSKLTWRPHLKKLKTECQSKFLVTAPGDLTQKAQSQFIKHLYSH